MMVSAADGGTGGFEPSSTTSTGQNFCAARATPATVSGWLKQGMITHNFIANPQRCAVCALPTPSPTFQFLRAKPAGSAARFLPAPGTLRANLPLKRRHETKLQSNPIVRCQSAPQLQTLPRFWLLPGPTAKSKGKLKCL